MTTHMQEMDRTYEAGPDVPLPSLDGLPEVAAVSGPETERLNAAYYDTGDLRLLKAGVTLRRQDAGPDKGWELQLRDESPLAAVAPQHTIQLPPETPGDPVPEELAREVRVHTRGAALSLVVHIGTRRRRTTLLDSAGTSLAEVVVDEVKAQTFGTSTTVSRWNEIQVELTGGSPALLRAADRQLRHGGLRPAGPSAELTRALGAALPAARPGHRLSRRSPSGEVVLAYLKSQAARLKSLDPAVRRGEPDSVHQMRVTTRRLRSTLQAFPAVVAEPATRKLRDELKWLGGVLGEARDDEVLSEYLRTRLAGTPVELVLGPVQARVTAYFAAREASARGAVLEALDSRRYFDVLDELDRLLDDPPAAPAAQRRADEVVSRAVAQTYRRVRRWMRSAKRAPEGSARDVALHETRKAAKRARYAAEAAEPVFGQQASRFAERMKDIQSVLGDHQDAVTARVATREIGVQAYLAGENAFSFGLLNELAHQDALARQGQAGQAWQQAKRSARTWPGTS